MHVAYICIREKQTRRNALAFAAECGEAKDKNTGMFLSCC